MKRHFYALYLLCERKQIVINIVITFSLSGEIILFHAEDDVSSAYFQMHCLFIQLLTNLKRFWRKFILLSLLGFENSHFILESGKLKIILIESSLSELSGPKKLAKMQYANFFDENELCAKGGARRAPPAPRFYMHPSLAAAGVWRGLAAKLLPSVGVRDHVRAVVR